MAAHNIPQAEENPEQHHDNEKPAEQLAIAQHKLEFALVIPRHILDDYPSPSFPVIPFVTGWAARRRPCPARGPTLAVYREEAEIQWESFSPLLSRPASRGNST